MFHTMCTTLIQNWEQVCSQMIRHSEKNSTDLQSWWSEWENTNQIDEGKEFNFVKARCGSLKMKHA